MIALKKALKILGLSVIMLILLRGVIYRLAIKYKETGSRTEVVITNPGLIKKIDGRFNSPQNAKDIVDIADKITNELLSFSSDKVSKDPNVLVDSKKANCVGYSSMFNSIANYLIVKSNLQGVIIAEHKVGRLELLGLDLHPYLDNPFYKDHDYNIVTDTKAGEKITIDPSVSDVFGIRRIAVAK